MFPITRTNPSSTADAPLFVILHEQRGRRPDGTFTPAATVAFTSALRTSGLLAALPGEEVKSLLFLLTFVTANGRVEPSLPEVAGAMHVSEGKTRDRLLRLQTFLWQGKPLVRSRQRELGLDAYTLAPRLVAVGHASEPSPVAGSAPPLPAAAGRDAIIAHSRTAYARPRAEVEQIVAEQLGHGAEPDGRGPDTPEGQARQRLLALGVSHAQADALLHSHPLQAIQDQLDWLGYRHAKNPARFIVAAIENRYEPPARVRLERAIADEEARQEQATSVEQGPEQQLRSIVADRGADMSLPIPPAVSEGNGASNLANNGVSLGT